MNIKTKDILIKSIVEYDNSNENLQTLYVSKVEDQLKKHEQGLKYIGMGLDSDMVIASKIFLRIIYNRNKLK